MLVCGVLILFVSTAVAAPIEWVQRTGVGKGYSYEATAIAADHAGDIFVTGRVSHNPDAGNPDYYLYTAKHAAADGHLLWEYTAPPSGGTSYDIGRIVRVDAAGDVIVASLHDARLHVVKFSGGDGGVLWEGPPYQFFATSDVSAMELDANRDVIVTGFTKDIAPNDSPPRFHTAKYSGSDGRLIWGQSYHPPSQPRDLAIDPAGHVIVAGGAQRPERQTPYLFDFFVTEYEAADGHVRWEYRYTGANVGQADCVAADASGNALVSGTANSDTYMAKLSAADGEMVWSNRIPGLVNRARRVTDMAVDNSGDVVIAAGDATSDSFRSFYTAKYEGASGRLVWEQKNRGAGPYTGGEAKGLQLGADGTVYVSGGMGNVAHRLYTAAYAGGDGALLWEQAYVSPGSDSPYEAAHPLVLLPENKLAVFGLEGGRRNLLTIKYSTAAQLLNISTRGRTDAGEDALISGFIVTGVSPKKVLLRALGPSLPFEGALQDPVLTLHLADGSTVFNNDWRDSQSAEIIATSIPPPNDKESAIVAVVPPGTHTAVVRGSNGGTGLALVEVYDIDAAAPATSANISTRGHVGTGADVMIGGLILRGPQPGSILIRAIGPSLTSAGVEDSLQDPMLELVDSNGNSIRNDDWQLDDAGAPDPTQQAQIEATGVAPTDSRESALLISLLPGSYTAIVRGKNDSTGIALVEAYNLE
jgi:hypothetical protein